MVKNRIVIRSVCGIEVTFVYVRRTKDIRFVADESAVKRADVLTLMRFWVTMSRWAGVVAVKNPGWKIGGYRLDDQDWENRRGQAPEEDSGTRTDSAESAGRSGVEVSEPDRAVRAGDAGGSDQEPSPELESSPGVSVGGHDQDS